MLIRERRRSEWRVLYKLSDKGDGLLEIHPTGHAGYSVLIVNAPRRATSPPVCIALITKNPACQGRLGLVHCFPNSSNTVLTNILAFQNLGTAEIGLLN